MLMKISVNSFSILFGIRLTGQRESRKWN